MSSGYRFAPSLSRKKRERGQNPQPGQALSAM